MTSIEWYNTTNVDDQKIGLKKKQILIGSLFFLTAFFSVLNLLYLKRLYRSQFPFWAIIRTKYREYAKFVLFGSLAGCFFLGFGVYKS